MWTLAKIVVGVGNFGLKLGRSIGEILERS